MHPGTGSQSSNCEDVQVEGIMSSMISVARKELCIFIFWCSMAQHTADHKTIVWVLLHNTVMYHVFHRDDKPFPQSMMTLHFALYMTLVYNNLAILSYLMYNE